MAQRLNWRCCGVQSGNFKTWKQYVRSWSQHRRWYHWGNRSVHSHYGGLVPYW